MHSTAHLRCKRATLLGHLAVAAVSSRTSLDVRLACQLACGADHRVMDGRATRRHCRWRAVRHATMHMRDLASLSRSRCRRRHGLKGELHLAHDTVHIVHDSVGNEPCGSRECIG